MPPDVRWWLCPTGTGVLIPLGLRPEYLQANSGHSPTDY